MKSTILNHTNRTVFIFLILFLSLAGIGYASIYPFISDYANGNVMPTTSSSLINNVSTYNNSWLNLNANGDYISLNNSIIFSPYANNNIASLVIYFKLANDTKGDTSVALQYILAKQDVNNYEYQIYRTNTSAIRFESYDSDKKTVLTSTLTSSYVYNVWYQAVITFNGQNTTSYFNGGQVNTKGINFNYTGNASLNLGKANDKIQTLNGSVIFFSYYNKTLSDNQIKVLYKELIKNNTGVRIPILNYHNIGTGATQYDSNITQFQEQMDYLYNSGYKTITLKNYYDWKVYGNFTMPKKPIILTFDDNLKSALTNASIIMDAYNFKGVEFVITNNVNTLTTYLTWVDLQTLINKGWEIGSHTVNSTINILTDCTNDECRIFQYNISKKNISENLNGYTATSFVYPGNNQNTGNISQCLQYYNICGAGANELTNIQFDYKNTNMTNEGLARIVIRNTTNLSYFKLLNIEDSELVQYNFKESSGSTLYDSSGNNNNGIISGATWQNDSVKLKLTSNQYTLSGSQFNLLDYYLDRNYMELDYYNVNLAQISPVSSSIATGALAVFVAIGMLLLIGYPVFKNYEDWEIKDWLQWMVISLIVLIMGIIVIQSIFAL